MPYIGRDLRTGAFRQLDDISSGFDGSDTTHTMQVNSTNVSVGDVNQILLSLGGVIQKPGTDFTVSGSTLTFTTAPAANTNFFAILLGSDNGGTVTPTDASVTPPKTTFFNTDPGNAADLGMLHIKSGDSGGGVASSADELVVEGSANSGISILSGASDIGRLNFGDSGDNDVGIIFYNHSDNSLTIRNNATNHMVIDSDGAVTKPLQPAFNVLVGSTQTFTANTNTTVVFGTERYDTNGDFASNTFTAPVTGKYLLSYGIYFMDVDTDMNYVQNEITTSNRTYYNAFSTTGFDATNAYWNLNQTVVADMDANDTAVVKVYFNAGSALRADGSSVFSGILIG